MITQTVRIPVGKLLLDGDLQIPDRARGIILFAHGSGSSRHSTRNRFVANHLNAGGLATMLMDLLTTQEERADEVTGHLRFDISLLADRLVAATDWLAKRSDTGNLRQGYFGASTGGGAALVAAARRPESIVAVVSRGGRPDLAGEALPQVKGPTLLIVGGDDEPVIGMNQKAMEQMRCEKQLVVVPGATHLFEESGALDRVANLARDWFDHHMKAATRACDHGRPAASPRQ